MSQAALLQAVQAELHSAVASLSTKNCEIRGDEGQPPARFGKKSFVAIVPSGWSPGDTGPGGLNLGIDEVYSIRLVISYRTGHIPDDILMGKAFIDATNGLEPLIRSIMVVMRKNRYTDGSSGGILTRANASISGTDKFVEPLRWIGNDIQPQPVGPEWFHSEGRNPGAYGWMFNMHYGDARRLQTESNLE